MENPIQIKELEEFKRSIKAGDKIIYIEETPRDDGIKGKSVIKRVMEIEKIHRHTVDLKLGKLKRNITIKEALIQNRKRQMVAGKTGYSNQRANKIQRAEKKNRKKPKEE